MINISNISLLDPRRQEVSSPEGVSSVLNDQVKRLKIYTEDILNPTVDAEAEPVVQRYDPDEITFIQFDPYDAVIRQGSLAGGEVIKVENGGYYFDTRPANPPVLVHADTWQLGLQTILWGTKRNNSTEEEQGYQYLLVYSLNTARLLPRLKSNIDKAQKDTGTTIGYTTSQLAIYLQAGIEYINSQQPLTFMSLEQFPVRSHAQILVDAATIVALFSQSMFAVDTDMQYNDQGFSFTIDHASKLGSVIGMLQSRFAIQLRDFKMLYCQTGSIHTQLGPNYRLLSLLQAAPSGSLFRNAFMGGP